MSRVRTTLLITALLLSGAAAVAAEEAPLPLHSRLPQDPLLALSVSTAELGGKLQSAGEWLTENEAGHRLPAWLAEFEGTALVDGLLSSVGEDVALSIDLPPLDAIAAALQIGGPAAYSTALTHSGVMADVRDEQKLAADLRALLASISATSAEHDGVAHARVPLTPGVDADSTAFLDLYYGMRDGHIAVGFSQDWVVSALTEGPASERLVGGEDFRRVFANLDSQPQSLSYVNLPRLRDLIDGSQIVAALLESNPDTRRYVMPLLDADVMSVGLGSTSVPVADGVRTTHFGPYWMSGTAGSSSLLAALAVPSLLVAAERGRARETLSDIQSIAVACEGFSRDARGYPGPTDGWVPIGEVAAFLEPIYIHALPRTDAWDNPILYWSDGATYRVMSTGPDGLMDRAWQDVTEPTVSAKKVGDIVVADGRVLALPRQISD